MSTFTLQHSHVARQPATAPPPGYMTLTMVGSGVSTGVPVIGHLGLGCACEAAVADPTGPNSRNNISLLITLPRRDLPDLEELQRNAAAAAERAKSDTAQPGSAAAGPSHACFAVTRPGNYMGAKPVAHILIDCGKTFRDAYFNVMIKCDIRTVDTLLLTHGHADAVAGLDDLRDLQAMHMVASGDWVIDTFVPTYLSRSTFAVLEKSVDYIVRNSVVSGDAMATPAEHAAQQTGCLEQREAQAVAKGKAEQEGRWRNICIRRSTALDLFFMNEDAPAKLHLPITATAATASGSRQRHAGEEGAEAEAEAELPFYSFPVEHGKGYTSMAWVFGRGTAFRSRPGAPAAGSCVVYISDVSEVPAASMAFLQDLVKIDVLFVDCLSPAGRKSPVHYCEDDMMGLVVALKPRYVFGVGMHCALEHSVWLAELQSALDACVAAGALQPGEVQSVQLGYDGMQVTLPQ